MARYVWINGNRYDESEIDSVMKDGIYESLDEWYEDEEEREWEKDEQRRQRLLDDEAVRQSES